MKELFIILLLISTILIAGCTQPVQETLPTTENFEEQVMSEIEQEMENTIKNITLEDIEMALLE